MDALKQLGEQLKKLRKYGWMTVTCPRQRFRFSCVVTSECQDGYWVVTDRSLTMDRSSDSSHDVERPPCCRTGRALLCRTADRELGGGPQRSGGTEDEGVRAGLQIACWGALLTGGENGFGTFRIY